MKRAYRLTIARLLLCVLLAFALCPAVSAREADRAGTAGADDGFFEHFCGHFSRAVGSAGIDTALDAAGSLLDETPSSLWKKLTSLTLAGKSIPELLSGGLSWQTGATLLYALWDAIPKDKFKRLMRELLQCPRCRAFAWEFTVGLGESAWQKLKDGGSWVGEKSSSFWNWIWSDEPEVPEADRGPGFWASVWQKTKDGSAYAWQKTKDGSAYAWQKTKDCGTYVGEKAASGWDAVKRGTVSAWRWLRGSESKPESALTEEKRPGFWASAKESVVAWGSAAWQKTKDGGSWVGEKAGSAWDWAGECAGSAWRKAKDGGSYVKEKAAGLWRWAWE